VGESAHRELALAGSAKEELLARAAGLPLARFQDEHVAERIRRALERETVPDVVALAGRIARNPSARTRFRRSVAVSVSGMFRDAEQFVQLERELLPPLLEDGRRIRVWSAGCADGTELYSVAVLLDRRGSLDRAQLLGSDLLEENVALARRGMGAEPMLAEPLRRRVRWEQRDVVAGAPGGSWSLVLCRNLAIYLAPRARRALHGILSRALRPGGVLLLGRSERLSDPWRLGLEPAGPHAYRRRA